jgi:hypothetical protein
VQPQLELEETDLAKSSPMSFTITQPGKTIMIRVIREKIKFFETIFARIDFAS